MTVCVLRCDPSLPLHSSHFFYPEALWGAVPPLPVNLAPAPGPNPTHPTSRPPPSTSRATPQTAPRSAPAPATTGPSSSAAPQINCFCGKPSVELTVKKESANKGRQFRRCGQPESCDFFEWTDEPPRDAAGMTGMKRGGGPPNPPSIPAKRSRTDDAVRVSTSTPTPRPPPNAPPFIRPQRSIVSVT